MSSPNEFIGINGLNCTTPSAICNWDQRNCGHGCSFPKSIGGSEDEKCSMYNQNPDEIGFIFRFDPFSYHYWGLGPTLVGDSTNNWGGGGLGHSQRDIVTPLIEVGPQPQVTNIIKQILFAHALPGGCHASPDIIPKCEPSHNEQTAQAALLDTAN